MWTANILTLFPELFPGCLATSITGRALEQGICEINARNIRDYAKDKHQTVDDTPYGGGAGMVMRADVLGAAIEDFFLPNGMEIYYLTPKGKPFNQKMAHELSANKGINLLCGRFEGVDERVVLEYKLEPISVGDYVLTSGDVAAYSILDACMRLLPGVIEQKDSLKEESFAQDGEFKNLLEYPHYTRPAEWHGREVPAVLLSGNHQEIKKWRLKEALKLTKIVRPDLLDLCKDGEK